MNNSLALIKWLIKDLIVGSAVPIIGKISLVLFYVCYPFNRHFAYISLLKSSRYTQSERASLLIASHRLKMRPHLERIIGEQALADSTGKRKSYRRAIVLNNPKITDSKIIKGILLIKFTDTFNYYCSDIQIEQLIKYFHVILEPSWAGYALPEILYWSYFNEKILIESSEITDRKLIEGLKSNLIPVSFGSSDWVNHEVFKPLNLEKEYASVYVANFNAIKRHHIYFKALSKIDTGKKSALVCGQWGESQKDIESLIEYYDLKESLDVYVGLSHDELNELLNKSKVNVLLSHKEGSNRSIFEGFFSGVPGIVLSSNIGVNKNYINEFTGKLVTDEELADALKYFDKNWQQYDTRTWAMNNISAVKTTKKMIGLFYSDLDDESKKWAAQTAVKVNSPEAIYFDKENEKVMLDSLDIINIFSKSNVDEAMPSNLNKTINDIAKKLA